VVEAVKGIEAEIMELIDKSGAVVPKGSVMLLSHHYGKDKFRQYGAAVIECFNMEDYAKKILVMLPMQRHPSHYHVKKHETFHVLYGLLTVDLEGDKVNGHTILSPGEYIEVPPFTAHKFFSGSGVVFEEISTHQFEGDSIYHLIVSPDRKTKVREF
jgi:D-lyxose ketol-isomerase